MSEHRFEAREVARECPEVETDRLRESVVGDVAASVSAMASVGVLGYTAAAFRSRLRRAEVEAHHQAEMSAPSAAR